MEQSDADAVRGRIKPTLDYADLADCDLVIEAITEDLDAEARDVEELDGIVKDERHVRDQHLVAVGRRPGGGDLAAGALPRPPLLQPRPGDAAARGGARGRRPATTP